MPSLNFVPGAPCKVDDVLKKTIALDSAGRLIIGLRDVLAHLKLQQNLLGFCLSETAMVCSRANKNGFAFID